jgi:uncharacterized protein YjbI with pentapeptide repeats
LWNILFSKVDAEVIANQRVCCWTCRDWTCTDIMTLLIVVYLLCEGTCAACKACLISEALSPTDVNIGFKACRSTVKSLTYPTEKLVETVGAAVIVLEGMMLEVAHLETVKSSITDAIKESVNFDRIRLTGCSLHHQRLEDAIVRGVTRIGSWWKRSVVLNAVSKKNTALPIIQFSQHDISIHASLLLCILW